MKKAAKSFNSAAFNFYLYLTTSLEHLCVVSHDKSSISFLPFSLPLHFHDLTLFSFAPWATTCFGCFFKKYHERIKNVCYYTIAFLFAKRQLCRLTVLVTLSLKHAPKQIKTCVIKNPLLQI